LLEQKGLQLIQKKLTDDVETTLSGSVSSRSNRQRHPERLCYR